MATEPQHSETMSGETTSSAKDSSVMPDAPAAAARPDVGADAALIVEALGRMEAAIRDERAVLDRLRTGLADMAQAVAQAKAVADSETAALLLDEFEHRIDAMIEIAGGARPAAAAPVPPVPPVEPQPVAALADMPIAPAAARDQTADDIPASQVIETAAEDDQVPTVSGVVSRLGSDHDAFNEAIVRALQSTEADDDRGPSVAMLKAMVEALSVEAPVEAAEPEATTEIAELEVAELEVAESEAQPAEAVIAAPESAHAAHDPAEPAATAEIQEPAPEIAAFVTEFAERPHDTAMQPSAEISTPEFLEEAQSPVEPTATTEIQELAPEPTATAEVQEAAPDVTAFAVEFAAPPDDAGELSAEAAAPEVAEATPAAEATRPASWPGDAVVREGVLLASLEQMGSRPFQPSDEGTAVIFTVPAEPEAVSEPNPEPEPAAWAEPALPEPEPAGVPFPDPEPTAVAVAEPVVTEAAAPTHDPDAELERALADPDFDPTDFLFGPAPEPDPAAFLLEPAPQPPVHRPIALPEPEFGSTPFEPPAEASQAAEHDQPAQPAPHDPLRAFKAMSPEEKIALFT